MNLKWEFFEAPRERSTFKEMATMSLLKREMTEGGISQAFNGHKSNMKVTQKI